jgi:hypothetical protein
MQFLAPDGIVHPYKSTAGVGRVVAASAIKIHPVGALVDGALFDEVHEDRHPTMQRFDVAVRVRLAHVGRRELSGAALVVHEGDADLVQVIGALSPPRRFTRRLHGRQQKGDQHPDDGDDDQELDERKTVS